MESKTTNTLDLTGGTAVNGVYDLPGSCGNCGWVGTLVIRWGEKKPGVEGAHRDSRAHCPTCGCRTVSASA